MHIPIITFESLKSFIEEPTCRDNIIRVNCLDITKSVSAQYPGLRTAEIGVHIRAINDAGQILTCYLPIAKIQLYDGDRREGAPNWEAYENAWDEAVALRERVLDYLTAETAHKKCSVLSFGVIYVPPETLLRATWKSDPARVNPPG